jgi:adenylate cyclase
MPAYPTLDESGKPANGHTAVVDDDGHRLTATELAALAGVTHDRVATLAKLGVIQLLDDGTFHAGDVHVLRLLDGFEASGVPVEALVAGMATGRLDLAGYHDLHRDPGRPSKGSYRQFRAAVDPDGRRLSALFTALGLAEPDPEIRLTTIDEARLETWLTHLRSIDDADLLVRVIRLHGEAARRTAGAALDVYTEAALRLGPDPVSVDPDAYARLLEQWARIARELPELAAWLTERHLRDAIDSFSVDMSEQLLAAEGIVRPRTVAPPGIAFVDLTGYTLATRQLGDEIAAARSLQLGELARAAAHLRGGRLIKLLGDGALLWLPDAVSAVETSIALLEAIVDAGLGGGHAGVHCGPVIEREGDVYGATVNIAARISDHASDGEVEVSADVASALVAVGIGCEPIGSVALQGLDEIELFRVVVGRRAA